METPLKVALQSVSPQVYQNLKRAVELGKWPDGSLLTVKQREHALQLTIGYEALNVPAEQRSGYMSVQACESKVSQDQSASASDAGLVRFEP